jgi:hypothetical protein
MAGRAWGLALFGAAAFVSACGPYGVDVGGPPLADAGPLTEDQALAEFGRRLGGMWTGIAMIQTNPIFGPETSPWDLYWQPDPERSQTGTLIMGCSSLEGCLPTLRKRSPPAEFHLNEIAADGSVSGTILLSLDGSGDEQAMSIELRLSSSEASPPGRVLSFKVTSLVGDFLVGTFEQISSNPSGL